MTIIDVHAHIIVPEPAALRLRKGWRPRVSWEGGRQIVELGGRLISVRDP
jgi:hypothetical protein